MASRVVSGEHLGTTYDDNPTIRVVNHPNGPTEVLIEYISAPEGRRRTRLRFLNVYQYVWIDEFIHLDPSDADFEFSLIEILQSDLIGRMVEFSPYRNASNGEGLGGTLKETELHHYRIDFDDHGTYDVVCTDLEVEVL